MGPPMHQPAPVRANPATPTPMRRIHVYLPKSLAERMDHLIETEGFKGPSEFVRFMIKYFEYLPPIPKNTNLRRFRALSPFKHNEYLAPPSREKIHPNFFTF